MNAAEATALADLLMTALRVRYGDKWTGEQVGHIALALAALIGQLLGHAYPEVSDQELADMLRCLNDQAWRSIRIGQRAKAARMPRKPRSKRSMGTT